MAYSDSRVQRMNWEDILIDNVRYKIVGKTIMCDLVPGASKNRVTFFTPPFITNFPKLVSDVDPETTDDEKKVKAATLTVDLTMKGAEDVHRRFYEFTRALDDTLLDVVHCNQHMVGKVNLSKEQLVPLQKRIFRERISQSTGRQYDDAFLPRCKAFTKAGPHWCRNSVRVFDEENNPTMEYPENGEVVQACVRYDGPFASSAIGFGHTFTLLAVKKLGRPKSADTFEAATDGGSAAFEFPDVPSGDMPVL